MNKRVPDILLEHLLLGELTPEESKRVLSDLGREEGGLERLEKMKRSNEEILAAYPSRSVSASIKQRYERSKEKEGAFFLLLRRFEMKYLLRPVPIAGILLFFLLAPWIIQRAFFYDRTGVKGGEELFVYLKQGKSERKLKPGDRVRKGGLVQVAYTAGDAVYGVIFSVDGRGTVTLHYPGRENESNQLMRGGKKALGESYELDDAPFFEHFFFAASAKKIGTGPVLDLVRSLRNDPEKIKSALRRAFPGVKVADVKLTKE